MTDRRDFVSQIAALSGFAMANEPWRSSADFGFATAGEALAALRARRISAVELTRLALTRIERYNPKLNAIVNVLTESALARAKEADVAASRGRSLGGLHGLPVTVKDTFEIAGVRTTAGFEPLKSHVPKNDAAAVTRLRQAGAVILGNTNVPPLAGDWQSDNPIYGRTNSPIDLERTPGGSSGGSAAAVAAGLGYLSIGSDIGGSIRVPASWTGTYGHKPTLNLVPLRGHIPPMPGSVTPPPSLPVGGPMTRSAEDLLLGLKALGGPVGEDAVAYRWTLPPARRRLLKEFRVGCVLDHPACRVTSEVREVLERAVAAIRGAGATVTDGWPPGVDPHRQFRTYEYLVSVAAFGGNLDESKIEETRRIAATSDSSLDAVIARAQTDPWKRIMARDEERMLARAAWQSWFHSHDVFLMPVVFTPAPRHMQPMTPLPTSQGPRPYLDLLWWIGFATLTGCPATSAPVGRTAEGLPVGLQIMGPFLEDATPIAFAARLAELVGGFEPPKGYA
jgi:amidase